MEQDLTFEAPDLAKFQKHFEFWQDTLNCRDYECTFEFMDFTEDLAEIVVWGGNQATIRLAQKIPKDAVNDFVGLDALARHEALHLFLEKIIRYVPTKIEATEHFLATEEGMVIVLEKLLKRSS